MTVACRIASFQTRIDILPDVWRWRHRSRRTGAGISQATIQRGLREREAPSLPFNRASESSTRSRMRTPGMVITLRHDESFRSWLSYPSKSTSVLMTLPSFMQHLATKTTRLYGSNKPMNRESQG